MDHRLVLQQLDEDRRTISRGGEVIEMLPQVTRWHSPNGAYHAVIYSSLTRETATAQIACEIEHFRKMNAQFEWKVYSHDQPADLVERLRQNGFEIGPSEAVMVLDLQDQPAWLSSPPRHTVVRVDQLDQIDLFCTAAEAIFEKKYSFTAADLAEGIRSGSEEHRGYIAMSDGVAVSIGRLYTHPRSLFGGLYGGGTLKSHRGQGLYRALVAARARDALRLGARYLIVDALPTSQPILASLGFEHLADTWPCVWRP